MLVLSLLFAGCLDYEAPPPPPPPPGAQERPEISMIPPGGDLDGVAPAGPPVIRKVEIAPDRPTVLQPLRVVAEAEDRDTQKLDYDYRWILNGQERPDLTTEELPADTFTKGDRVSVKVVVSDGEHEVEKVSSEVTIKNSPPEFVGDPRLAGQLDGLVVKATDPDEDELTWRISGAPAGMSIDPRLGRVSYQGSEDEEGGAYQITITADDGDGGTADWSFKVEVSPGSKAVERKKQAEAAKAGG